MNNYLFPQKIKVKGMGLWLRTGFSSPAQKVQLFLNSFGHSVLLTLMPLLVEANMYTNNEILWKTANKNGQIYSLFCELDLFSEVLW